MNCQQTKLQILELWNSGTDPVMDSAVQQHLGVCPACSTFQLEQKEITRLLGEQLPELEPPARIWLQIEEQISVPQDKGWEFSLQGVIDLFWLPQFKQVAAGLAMAVIFSVLLLNLAENTVEPEVLAELEAYHLDIQDNPFLSRGEESNPFFDLSPGLRGNPFEEVGSQ